MNFDRSLFTCSYEGGEQALIISNLAPLLVLFRVTAASMAEKGLIITCQLTIVPRFDLAFLAGGGSGGGDRPSQTTLSTMKAKDARVYLHDASRCLVHFPLCGLLYLCGNIYMIRGFPSLFRLMVDFNEVLGIYSFSICLNDTTLPFILDM